MAKTQEKNGNGKLKNKKYMKELRRLQAELCILQECVKHKGLRIIVVFEGRDGAGKAARFAPSPSVSAPACSASWRYPRRPTARKVRCTSSAT